jgi:hypothetical protein
MREAEVLELREREQCRQVVVGQVEESEVERREPAKRTEGAQYAAGSSRCATICRSRSLRVTG